jgi:hypothetical protein
MTITSLGDDWATKVGTSIEQEGFLHQPKSCPDYPQATVISRQDEAGPRQEERHLGTGKPREAEQQEERSHDAARDHHARKGRKVLALESRLLPSLAESRHQRQADARAEIEEASQQEGLRRREQQLGDRRGEPEEDGGPKTSHRPAGWAHVGHARGYSATPRLRRR